MGARVCSGYVLWTNDASNTFFFLWILPFHAHSTVCNKTCDCLATHPIQFDSHSHMPNPSAATQPLPWLSNSLGSAPIHPNTIRANPIYVAVDIPSPSPFNVPWLIIIIGTTYRGTVSRAEQKACQLLLLRFFMHPLQSMRCDLQPSPFFSPSSYAYKPCLLSSSPKHDRVMSLVPISIIQRATISLL